MINFFKLFQRKMTPKRLYRKMQNSDIHTKIINHYRHNDGFVLDFKMSTGEWVKTYWDVEFCNGIVNIDGIEKYPSSSLTKKIQALAKFKAV